ncbi:hypothetical protein ABPG72_006501 [Tetrahymena utriculariae]
MADFNKVKEFYKHISQKLSTVNSDESHVINFDETTITKSQQANYTVKVKEEKHIQIKQNQNEQSYSLGLSISKNGIKLKQMIVWPSKEIKNLISIKNYLEIGLKLFKHYIKSHLSKDRKGILIINNFKVHKISELQDIIEAFPYVLIYLSPNSTYIIQPLDIYVNKSNKQTYRQLIIDSKYDERQLSHQDFIYILTKVWTQIDVASSWSIYDKSDFLEQLEPQFITYEIDIQLQKQTILIKDEQQQQDNLDDIIEDLSNNFYSNTQQESSENRSSQSNNFSQSESSIESESSNHNNNSSNYIRSESKSKSSYNS